MEPPGRSGRRDGMATALPIQLTVVQGPDKLPADERSQEVLREKLCILLADSTEVDALFTELSAHLVSICSEENTIFVAFKTLEDILKFTTYYNTGFLGHCVESLLFDQKLWLTTLDDSVFIRVSVPEDTLSAIYRGILVHEGSLFACCTSSQMFDSCTSGGDLYLEQGDIAQFEPPYLGSGWTVLCLSDGARGTAPSPALEPVLPFYQWFLRSLEENSVVGDGKPVDVPLLCARGTCLVTADYDAERPDELSVATGDRIAIVGLLAPCFAWFLGRKEKTGQVGLVKTSLVEASTETQDPADIFLDEEPRTFFDETEEEIIQDANTLLQSISRNDFGQSYKLDVLDGHHVSDCTTATSRNRSAGHSDSKRDLQWIPHSSGMSSAGSGESSQSRVDPNWSKAAAAAAFCFSVPPMEEATSPENLTPLLTSLEGPDYRPEFGALYGLSSASLCSSAFSGHGDDDELIAFLGVARETARKKSLFWPQSRLCFLLGKLCGGRSKFSQARVYFEEALSVPRQNFLDLKLLASIYSNLASIYLLQKNAEKHFSLMDRLAALTMGIPERTLGLGDDAIFKYILRKAIVSHNTALEARACYLLAWHHWARAEAERILPYLERLLLLCEEGRASWSFSPCHGYLTLARVYRQLGLPRLSVGAARRASLQTSTTLSSCLAAMLLLCENIRELADPAERHCSIPAEMAPYLLQALSVAGSLQCESNQHGRLRHRVTVCLCQLFHRHGMVGRAIRLLQALIHSSSPPGDLASSGPDRDGSVIWLGWLHMENQQPAEALEILDSVLASMPEHCTTRQEGVVLNMRGVAFRCLGDLRRAAESYQAAIDICEEYEDYQNWAVAQANLGLLCVRAGAVCLAERHLTRAVQLFSELDGEGHSENFIAVLLELGQHHVQQSQRDYAKACYEWALLLAIYTHLTHCQLTVTWRLCQLYSCESPDQTQCIIYNQHLVQLLQHSGDRRQEGDVLSTISHLYFTLSTQSAYRVALDYTKRSLGISIDLGCKEKEAYGWLHAGKIYHMLGQTELVDMYLQVAQDVALKTGDTGFVLLLLEAAGDVFFNSCQHQDKAVCFYRDRALPIAVKNANILSRLRLCNKLSELLLSLKLYEEALEFAQTALDISITLAEQLNERVAHHRLASLHRCLGHFELAEHHYLKALALCPMPLQFDEETLYYVSVYQTLGDIMFYDVKDPFDAAGYYHLALAAAMDLGNKKSQLQLCTRLATIYHNFLINRQLSLFFYQKARGFAADLNVKRIKISAETQLNSSSQYKSHGKRETEREV